MKISVNSILLYGGILVAGVAAPYLFPAYKLQVALLWMMILFALTWDLMGGQMGYNSLGNIFFFGAGMYICALTQVGLFTDVGTYTAAFGGETLNLDYGDYFYGLAVGLIAAALGCVVLAYILGSTLFGLRGAYFAIGTLGIALAAAELIGAWDWAGGGGGVALPIYPGEPDDRSTIYYMLCFGSAVATFIVVKFLYSTRFGLAINAIRDDESKAEAMGIHTMRHKNFAWAVAAFFLAISGGLFGNITGFIEPLEVAFPTVTFGIFMVAMTLLGGKGTLWGPVLGAVLFHTLKELTWTLFLGWQWVLLGLLIIINVVFFQQGIMGWLMEKFPERFGRVVDHGNQKTEAAE